MTFISWLLTRLLQLGIVLMLLLVLFAAFYAGWKVLLG